MSVVIYLCISIEQPEIRKQKRNATGPIREACFRNATPKSNRKISFFLVACELRRATGALHQKSTEKVYYFLIANELPVRCIVTNIN